MTLQQVTFQQITDNFHWVTYCGLRAIIDIKTGYVNVTHLCELWGTQGPKKNFNNWLRSATGKDLIGEVSAITSLHVHKLIVKPSIDSPIGQGSVYAHPDLVPHIACWVSPKFAIKIGKIMNDWLSINQSNKSMFIGPDIEPAAPFEPAVIPAVIPAVTTTHFPNILEVIAPTLSIQPIQPIQPIPDVVSDVPKIEIPQIDQVLTAAEPEKSRGFTENALKAMYRIIRRIRNYVRIICRRVIT